MLKSFNRKKVHCSQKKIGGEGPRKRSQPCSKKGGSVPEKKKSTVGPMNEKD